VPRTLPPPEKLASRAQREREAKAYWESLTEAQEASVQPTAKFLNLGILRLHIGSLRRGRRAMSGLAVDAFERFFGPLLILESDDEGVPAS